MDLSALIEKLEDLKEKYNSVTRALNKLNDFYSKGEITEKQFKILKSDYEKEIANLSREIENIQLTLREELEKLESALKAQNLEYNKTKIDILLGEIPAEQGRLKLANIAKQIALTQHSYNQYKLLLEAQTEEEFKKVREMTPPSSIKLENVVPVKVLLDMEADLRTKRLKGKGQVALRQLEELYNRLEKIRDFLLESLKQVEAEKNEFEEEAGKLVIKIRMGGPEEADTRNKLTEVINKIKEYDDLLAKMSKMVEVINERLGYKESVLIEAQEEATKIGVIEDFNLDEAAKFLEELEKRGIEQVSTESTLPPIEVEKREEEKPSEPKIRVGGRKKRSPVPAILVTILVIFGAIFAVYRKFFFVQTTEKQEIVYPSYMGNEAHNFNIQSHISQNPPRLEWSRNLEGTPSQPAIYNGVLYVGTSTGKLYAIDSTGNIIWTTQLQGTIMHAPYMSNNNLIVGTTEGNLYLLNISGQIIRTTKIQGSCVSSPIAFGEHIYVPTFQDGLYAYNINQDRIDWKFQTTGMLRNTPIVYKDHLYIGDLAGRIYVINRANGLEEATFKTSGPIEAFLTFVQNKIFYGNNAGEIGVFDINNNTLLWSFNVMEPIVGAPSIKDSFVVYSSAFGKIFCHNTNNGIRLWNFDTGNLIYSIPVVVDTFVLVSTTTSAGDFGELYCLNIKNGNVVWVIPFPKVLETSPVLWGNRLYIAGRDGTLLSLAF